MTDDLLELPGGETLESVTTVISAPEAEEEVWTHLPEDRPTLELGDVVNPPKVCEHGAAELVMVESLVALIEDEPPRLELRVKAICQCGIDFAVAREGRAPRDGSPGTVLVLTPAPCDTRGNPD